ELVISQLPEDIAVTDGDVVEELVGTSAARQCKGPFLRNEAVEFEFSNLYVQPRTLKQIIEADVSRFEVESTGLIRRGDEEESNIFFQSTARENIQSTEIETGSGDLLLPCKASGGVVDRYFVGAFAAPEWSNAQGDRPVAGILP